VLESNIHLILANYSGEAAFPCMWLC